MNSKHRPHRCRRGYTALGSAIALARQDQSVETGYAYSPYGQTRKAGVEAGQLQDNNAIQYTARENDGAQGGTNGGELYYYRVRYYDPVLKRFISEDPIGLAGGDNVYGYVGGNPVSWTDPDGLRRQNDRPSTREIARSGGTLPLFQPTVAQNQRARDLINMMSSVPGDDGPTSPGANWPGIIRPVRFDPVILPPTPNGNGCMIIKDAQNQCPASGDGSGIRVYCGSVVGPRR